MALLYLNYDFMMKVVWEISMIQDFYDFCILSLDISKLRSPASLDN